MERITATANAELRNLFARMRLRIEELEQENANLRSLAGTYRWPHVRTRYETDEERQDARRRVWRDSKRRAKLRSAA